MGRHSTPGGSGRTRALVIASVAVVIAVTAGMMAWGSGVFSGGTSGTTSADATSAGPTAAPCPQPAPLVVVADPSIAPALRTVAEKMDAAPGACVRTTIRSETSATTSAALARGAGIDVDAWVPQSGVWAQRTALAARSLGAPAPQLQSLGVLASSPVVLAARTNSANVNADARPGWAAIAGPGVPALVPDPTESAVSLAALLAMRGTLPPGDPRAFPAAVIELGRNIPASADAAFATAAAGDQLVVSTEQALLGRPGFRAVYPAGGTVAVQYPMLRTAAADPGRDDRLAALRAAIVAARPVMAEAGFRDPTGGGELDAPGVSAAAVPATPVTDDAAQLDILRAWGVLTLRSRILSVIDVSGSMLQPAGGGLRRIDVFQRAAGGVIQRFPGDSEIGVWIFSTDRGGGRDWEDLVPVAPLKDPAHVQQINFRWCSRCPAGSAGGPRCTTPRWPRCAGCARRTTRPRSTRSCSSPTASTTTAGASTCPRCWPT